MLNINQLRAFYHVAKTLSFSAAAEELFVTQPAVTKQVKLFQECCNVNLIRRRKNKLYLTENGKKVLEYASRIFELEKQLEEKISAFQDSKLGSLYIGTTKIYAKYMMPTVLPLFQKLYPHVTIRLDEGNSLEITESLLSFKNSLVLVAKVKDNDKINFTKLMSEKIVLIVSPEHSLANRKFINVKELSGESLVIMEKGTGTRKYVEQLSADSKIKFNLLAQTGNMDYVKQIVKNNEAISFVVESAVYEELKSGELVAVKIADVSMILDIFLASLNDYELPLPAQNFEKFLLSCLDPENFFVGVQTFLKNIVSFYERNR